MKTKKTQKRIYWIDCMKGLAILSVVITHVSYFLGDYPRNIISPAIWSQIVFPFFWFYGLVGVTVWLSMRRVSANGSQPFWYSAVTFWKNKIRYVLLYIFGGLFCYFFLPSPTYSVISFPDFLIRLGKFSIQPPHHFFLTLFQFILLGPFVVRIVSKMQNVYMYMLSVGIVAIILIPVSRIVYYPIYAMPRPLYVGGWAFMIFYLGVGYMRFASVLRKIEIPIATVSLVAAISYLRITHSELPTQFITFPLILWFIASFLLVKNFIEITNKWRFFWNIFSYLGKYSWIIYLFHWSIIEFCIMLPRSYQFYSIPGVVLLTTLSTSVPLYIGLLITKAEKVLQNH